VAAVAVHVVDEDVVAAGDGDAIILVDDNAVTNFGVIGGREIEALAKSVDTINSCERSTYHRCCEKQVGRLSARSVHIQRCCST